MAMHSLKIGDRFLDRYEVTSVLGSGGMSRVYGAVQVGLGRKVAIKLLAPVGGENLTQSQLDNVAARFEREAQLISQFKSPHTVTMYDFGRSGDCLYMILEHVEGRNLHELIEQAGALAPARVVRILRQTLASLAEAHQLGTLHRDIKPQNIMVYEHLGDPNNVKVLDFGIAKAVGESERPEKKLTEERTVVGTPSYMSPEQILGHPLTPASDLYSLGLVAYELLYGVVAVDADSVVSTMARQLAPTPIELPERADVPPELVAVLTRLISKDAGARYQSAAELLVDLEALDGGAHLTVPRMSGLVSTREGSVATAPSARPLVVTGVLLSGTILVAVGVIVGLVWMMSAERAPAADAATSAPAPPAPAAAMRRAPLITTDEAPLPPTAGERAHAEPSPPADVLAVERELAPAATPVRADNAQKRPKRLAPTAEVTAAVVDAERREPPPEVPVAEAGPAETGPTEPEAIEHGRAAASNEPPATPAAPLLPAARAAAEAATSTAPASAARAENKKPADPLPEEPKKKPKKKAAPPLSF